QVCHAGGTNHLRIIGGWRDRVHLAWAAEIRGLLKMIPCVASSACDKAKHDQRPAKPLGGHSADLTSTMPSPTTVPRMARSESGFKTRISSPSEPASRARA